LEFFIFNLIFNWFFPFFPTLSISPVPFFWNVSSIPAYVFPSLRVKGRSPRAGCSLHNPGAACFFFSFGRSFFWTFSPSTPLRTQRIFPPFASFLFRRVTPPIALSSLKSTPTHAAAHQLPLFFGRSPAPPIPDLKGVWVITLVTGF